MTRDLWRFLSYDKKLDKLPNRYQYYRPSSLAILSTEITIINTILEMFVYPNDCKPRIFTFTGQLLITQLSAFVEGHWDMVCTSTVVNIIILYKKYRLDRMGIVINGVEHIMLFLLKIPFIFKRTSHVWIELIKR